MKVAVYDKNPGADVSDKFLAFFWMVGCFFAKLFRAIDDYHGATSWEDATGWLQSKGELQEVQYWGHGSPGRAYLAGKVLRVLDLEKVKMASDGLIWFRVCSSFQNAAGHNFAMRVSEVLGCNVAGHTRIIGLFQGGLHSLQVGTKPTWPMSEGEPVSKLPSWLVWGPKTIFCFRMSIPKGW